MGTHTDIGRRIGADIYPQGDRPRPVDILDHGCHLPLHNLPPSCGLRHSSASSSPNLMGVPHPQGRDFELQG